MTAIANSSGRPYTYKHHVRHRRVRGTEAGDSDPDRRAAAARVPRLRLGRRRDRRPRGTQVVRCRGKLAGLEAMVARETPEGTLGIGHTRWATHGRPSEENAHPHKAGASRSFTTASSRTTCRCGRAWRGPGESSPRRPTPRSSPTSSTRRCRRARRPWSKGCGGRSRQVHGAYALVVISDKHPGELVAAKNASPLVLGLGEGETFVASDVPAILEHTREVIFLDEGDIVAVTAGQAVITDVEGKPRERQARTITWDAVQAEKGGYPHFMLKEIHEQPRAVTDTLRGRLLLEDRDADLEGFELDPAGCGACCCSPAAPRTTRPGRQVPDRGDLAHPVRGRSRQRVSLPRSDGRAGRPRHRHLAERRDGRHAGRGQRGAGARRARAGDLQRRRLGDPARVERRPLHPRRARDRRRVDEVLHHAARRAALWSRSTSGGAPASSSPTRPPSWSRSWRSRRPR